METKGPQDQDPKGPEQEPKPKDGFDEKLDEVADKVSKTMSEGVKRLESAFESVKDNPEETKGKVKNFFKTSTGGTVILIIGILWLFLSQGWLTFPLFPVIVIGIGIYLMYRYKS
jgi:hypothetical protein